MADHLDWEQADEVTKRLFGGKYLKLEPGDSALGAFRAAPLGIEQHWTTDGSVRCSRTGCALCAKGVAVKARVRINFFDLKERVMKIAEGGGPWYRDLKVYKKKYDGTGKPAFEAMAFEITRHGVGKQTKYSIVPDGEMTAEQKALVAAASLHKLDAHDDDDPEEDSDDAAPLPAAVRQEFIARLQALKSEQALFAFLGEFGCERIGDVPAAEEARARRLLESLERKKPDINPFS